MVHSARGELIVEPESGTEISDMEIHPDSSLVFVDCHFRPSRKRDDSLICEGIDHSISATTVESTE
jgi:hypothetical protein